MADTHAPRRTPAAPDGPLDLASAAQELLATAHQQRSGRAARTLLPGAPAPLSQTLLALTTGTTLADHRAPGAATIQLLTGTATLRWAGQERELVAGSWAPIPRQTHGLEATTDVVALLSVVRDDGPEAA